MTQFNIRVSEELHRELKAEAAKSGKPLQTWAASILEKHLVETRNAARIAVLEAEIAQLKGQPKKL